MDQGLSQMSSREYSEWIAFASVEPIGEARKDLRTAQLCAMLVNVNRAKNQKAATVADYMPRFWKEDDQPTDDDMLAQAERITEMLGMVDEF